MKTTYALALGSNLGDRAQYLARARAALERLGIITAVSPIYQTAPLGPSKHIFLNQCLLFDSAHTPDALLPLLKNLEKKLGRLPRPTWHEREIDIDIIFATQNTIPLIIRTPVLSIPHTELAFRSFVLRPLSDIAPDFVHPLYHLTFTQLLTALSEPDIRSAQYTLPPHRLIP